MLHVIIVNLLNPICNFSYFRWAIYAMLLRTSCASQPFLDPPPPTLPLLAFQQTYILLNKCRFGRSSFTCRKDAVKRAVRNLFLTPDWAILTIHNIAPVQWHHSVLNMCHIWGDTLQSPEITRKLPAFFWYKLSFIFWGLQHAHGHFNVHLESYLHAKRVIPLRLLTAPLVKEIQHWRGPIYSSSFWQRMRSEANITRLG